MNEMREELLIKYLVREADDAERATVEAWISESQANREEFGRMQSIWLAGEALAEKSDVDTDAAWHRFRQKVESRPPEAKITKMRPYYSWIRIAAVLFVIGGGWMFFQTFRQNYERLEAGNSVLSQTLPDGSEVTLNKNSLLEYESDFSGTGRNVFLRKGEAFFDVVSNKEKPFVVEVGELRVQVVGTSFNIRSVGDLTEVIVESGRVRISKGSEHADLLPGEMIEFASGSGVLKKGLSQDQLHRYYRDQVIKADETPLWRLVEILNQAYDADIQIASPEIRDLRLSTTFRNEPLEQVIIVIAETLKIHAEWQGEKVVLRK